MNFQGPLQQLFSLHRPTCPAAMKMTTATAKIALIALTVFAGANSVKAQDDKIPVESALRIVPKQPDVDCDNPTGDEIKSCTAKRINEPAGFLVTDGSGRMLRLFTDTNDDKQLDRWSYFKNGIEVYREIDSNFDKKVDQYRWLGTGGTRWGSDPDQDETIDEWKQISAEEVAYETFHAIKAQDLKRFQRLLLTPVEFKELKLGTPIATEIQQRWKLAQTEFLNFCKSQKKISPSSQWVQSSNGFPSAVPAGANDNGRDLVAYDHASAVFKSDDYGNLAIGTIVQVDQGLWRLVELPELAEEGTAIVNGGVFFPLPELVGAGAVGPAANPGDVKAAERFARLDEIEDKLKESEKDFEIAKLEEERAKIFEEIYVATEPGEQKLNWLKSTVDSVTSAYQRDRFPDGLKFLEGLQTRVKQSGAKEGLDYIRWRSINSAYAMAIERGDKLEREEAHEKVIENQIEFQKEFPTSSLAAEALSALGVHYEISGETKEAIKWYTDLSRRFADTDFGKRAAGALVRLQGTGKALSFSGQDLRGAKFNLQDEKWRDKIVVIHFWETRATDGFDELQKLAEKYKDEVVIIGCNIESETEPFAAYLKQNANVITWPTLHAPGGMEGSPLAHQVGVSSLPLVLLIDKKGNLVEPEVAFGNLEREIERQRRKD